MHNDFGNLRHMWPDIFLKKDGFTFFVGQPCLVAATEPHTNSYWSFSSSQAFRNV